jgi:Uma2 family endonuclease
MAPKVRRWTRADLQRLPDDGNRYEVLDGALLVTPQASFGHQYVATKLTVVLAGYCERHGIAYVVAPGAVVFGGNELQPDVDVIPFGPYPRDRKWEELPTPLLVVEVRSDSTYRRDIGKKREAYQRVRIPEYWVIDPEARRALVWTPEADEPMIVADALRWHPRVELEPLVIPLASILPPEE